MQVKGFRIVWVIVLGVLASGAYLSTVIPASPVTQVHSEVISRTSRSGPTGNTGILFCKLENGSTLTIKAPSMAVIKKGDVIVLNTHDRYLFGPKYTFAGKLIVGSKNP